MLFLNSIGSILSIVIMISIGYVLTSKGWFSDESSKLLTKLVISIALPALMISTIMGNLNRSELVHIGKGIIIPVLSMTICLIIAIFVTKIMNIKKEHTGLFISMFFNSNTIFVGLPVNLALFGEKSIPYVLLYYIANTTFFWTMGVYFISKNGKEKSNEKIFCKKTLRRIISPPLLGYIVAITLVLLKVHLPNFIMGTCTYMGGITTPLSMIFIGICIYSVKLKNIKVSKDMVGIIAGRFIISPLTVFLITLFIPIPLLMKEVFIIQAAMPVMTNTSIIARDYNGDTEYAAVMTVVTTVLSIIAIPFYMLLLSYL